MEEFTCTARRTRQQTIVAVAGDVDLASWKQFQTEVSKWAGEPADLVLDCSGVTFLDSMGLSVLVHLRKQVTEDGRHFLLADASERVVRVMELAGVNKLFDHTNLPAHPDSADTL